jgi:hypothetical protein
MNKVFSSLIAILTVPALQAQQTAETPKLVVSITVDQLRGDYLQYFSSLFGEKGFKRLMNEGLVYHQVEFGFPNISEASAIATIYTGAYPFYHGICGDKKFDFESNREVSIITDNNYLGNYTSANVSPLALLSSTLGDELKQASEGKCNVFSIAPNAPGAVLSAGRYANAAFWLDDYNGKWATTTFYKEMPWYLEVFNAAEAVGNASEKTWLREHGYYRGFPYTKSADYFKYTFGKAEKDRYLKIKQTPLINAEITAIAGKFLEHAGWGEQNLPGLLMITYYAGDYKYGLNYDAYGYEIQDIYYRLDKELEKLFEMIDRQVGLKNTLIVLASTGYYDSNPPLPAEYKPSGTFYPNRCTALLNMFLMATYGQGNWVEGYYNNQIYLNKKQIEDRQINHKEFLANAADFVAQFSGVQDVTTLGQWLVDDAGRAATFRRGMHKKYSGDLFIELQPGWIVSGDETGSFNTPQYEHNTAILSPLFFLGEPAPKGHVHRKVKATEIAPTLSFILRIRPPNAAKDMPLQEFLH